MGTRANQRDRRRTTMRPVCQLRPGSVNVQSSAAISARMVGVISLTAVGRACHPGHCHHQTDLPQGIQFRQQVKQRCAPFGGNGTKTGWGGTTDHKCRRPSAGAHRVRQALPGPTFSGTDRPLAKPLRTPSRGISAISLMSWVVVPNAGTDHVQGPGFRNGRRQQGPEPKHRLFLRLWPAQRDQSGPNPTHA